MSTVEDRVDCPERCEIPPGTRLVDVPQPRHNWGDVVSCPNDGCGRSFLALAETEDRRKEKP